MKSVKLSATAYLHSEMKSIKRRIGFNPFLLFMFVSVGVVYSQPGRLPHMVEVKKYNDWGKGFLTVSYDGSADVGQNGSKFQTRVDYTCTTISHSFDSISFIQKGDLILEVDGVSAKNWTPEMFYKAIDGRKGEIALKLRSRWHGRILEHTIVVRPLFDNDLPATISYPRFDYTKARNLKAAIEATAKDGGVDNYELRSDKNFDFFNVLSYDFAIAGDTDDPLLDKLLLDYFLNHTNALVFEKMVRDEKNPDVIFTIARSVNMNISSTYVPPSSREVTTGSTTTAHYNWRTGRYEGSTTKYNTHTIHEGGYTVETSNTAFYLEIAALDAKKVNDINQTYPPIIWKSTINVNYEKSGLDREEVYKNLTRRMAFPCFDRCGGKEGPRIGGGIVVDETDPHVVKDVIPYTLAWSIGLKRGDRLIVNRDVTHGIWLSDQAVNRKVERKSKRKGWVGSLFPFHDDYLRCIDIDDDTYIDINWNGRYDYVWQTSRNYFGNFDIQRADGSTFTFNIRDSYEARVIITFLK